MLKKPEETWTTTLAGCLARNPQPFQTYIPAIHLDVTDGVTLATVGVHSRYNVHNTVVLNNFGLELLATGFVTQKEIVIISPYRRQNELLRAELRRSSHQAHLKASKTM